MSTPLPDYEKQVYAAVLGKTIGVYMGRPFEGWWKRSIEPKWGSIDRYVNEDVGKPLVVADDDISGTFTFVKALADWRGDPRAVDPAFFGETSSGGAASRSRPSTRRGCASSRACSLPKAAR